MFYYNNKTNQIQITQGDDILGFNFQVVDSETNQPVNLTGSTLTLTIKPTSDTDPLNSNAIVNKNLNIADPTNGIFELNLSNVETSPDNMQVGCYQYDIQQNIEVSPGVFNYVTIIKGIFEVTYQITVN